MKNITVEEVLREAAIYREMVLREAAIYREMVSVLLEQLHEADRRERYRKNRDDDNGNR